MLEMSFELLGLFYTNDKSGIWSWAVLKLIDFI